MGQGAFNVTGSPLGKICFNNPLHLNYVLFGAWEMWPSYGWLFLILRAVF